MLSQSSCHNVMNVLGWQFLCTAFVASTYFISVCSLPKYLAPEVLCTSVHNEPLCFDDDGCVCESFQDTSFVYASSPRSDVWSLGIILLEFLLVSLSVILKTIFKHFYFMFSNYVA